MSEQQGNHRITITNYIIIIINMYYNNKFKLKKDNQCKWKAKLIPLMLMDEDKSLVNKN